MSYKSRMLTLNSRSSKIDVSEDAQPNGLLASLLKQVNFGIILSLKQGLGCITLVYYKVKPAAPALIKTSSLPNSMHANHSMTSLNVIKPCNLSSSSESLSSSYNGVLSV